MTAPPRSCRRPTGGPPSWSRRGGRTWSGASCPRPRTCCVRRSRASRPGMMSRGRRGDIQACHRDRRTGAAPPSPGGCWNARSSCWNRCHPATRSPKRTPRAGCTTRWPAAPGRRCRGRQGPGARPACTPACEPGRWSRGASARVTLGDAGGIEDGREAVRVARSLEMPAALALVLGNLAECDG